MTIEMLVLVMNCLRELHRPVMFFLESAQLALEYYTLPAGNDRHTV